MTMLIAILQHTPTTVWAILAGLIALGLLQSVPRAVSLRRVVVLPLAITALSVHGTVSSFPAAPWSWVLWVGAAGVTATWFATADMPAGAQFDATRRVFHMPGSWQPMVLMMAIFAIRYAVGVVLGRSPALIHDPAAAAMVASVYGALSGVFLGRMVRMVRAAREAGPRVPSKQAMAWG
jgi:hypothetical protein